MSRRYYVNSIVELCGTLFQSTRGRVKFKVACLVRQSLSGQAPLYLADDSRLVSDSTRRSLRLAGVSTCVWCREHSAVIRYDTRCYFNVRSKADISQLNLPHGDRTFAAAGPRLRNSLPVQLRNPDITYGLFRRQLKEHFFREA